MGDKSKKSEDRPWSGAFPTLEKPSLKTILDEAKKNKKDEDNGALTGAFPTMRKPSIKKILKGKD